MKIVAILLGGLGLGAALAQEASTNKPPVEVDAGAGTVVAPADSRAVKSISRPAPAIPPGRVEIGGAIPKAARSKKVWQMLNPLAPKEYGDGTDVLARHPITGEAQGVTLFMVSCPEKPAQPKSKKKGATSRAAGK